MNNVTGKKLKSSIALLLLGGVLLILLGLGLILWPWVIVQILRWAIAIVSTALGVYIMVHTCVHAFR